MLLYCPEDKCCPGINVPKEDGLQSRSVLLRHISCPTSFTIDGVAFSIGTVCDTVRMTFSLEPCMRCHDVNRAQNCNTENSHETETEERQQNRRLSAHQSATSATHDLNRFSILCDSQKHTTCLDPYHKACLTYCNFSTDENSVWRQQGDKDSSNSDSNIVRSPNVSAQ